jgi:hypothetical protein
MAKSRRKPLAISDGGVTQATVKARLEAVADLWDGPVPESVVEHLRTFPVPPPPPLAYADIRMIYPPGITPSPLHLELVRKNSVGEPVSRTPFTTKVPRTEPTKEFVLLSELENVWSELGNYGIVRRLVQKASEEGKVEIILKGRRCWIHKRMFKKWVRPLIDLENRIEARNDPLKATCDAFDLEMKARRAAEQAAKKKRG